MHPIRQAIYFQICILHKVFTKKDVFDCGVYILGVDRFLPQIDQFWKKNSVFLKDVKGQKISKANYFALNFSTKPIKIFYPCVHFLEQLKTKKCFWDFLTFSDEVKKIGPIFTKCGSKIEVIKNCQHICCSPNTIFSSIPENHFWQGSIHTWRQIFR